jgi:gliding motility-associated-like protein
MYCNFIPLMRPLLLFTVVLFSLQSFAQELFVVNNLLDTGPGSLRTEIANAQDGDLVFINVTGTLFLQSPIQISENILIQGPMPTHFKIDGSASGSIFLITAPPGDFVYIDGIKFENSTSTAITVQTGVLYIGRSVFDFNDGLNGGVIQNNDDLSLEACSFISNTGNNGACIYNNGDLGVVNCTFYDNDANSNGGAIYQQSGTTTLWHNTFFENDCPGLGGAIELNAGSIEMESNLFFENGLSATSLDPTLNLAGGVFTSTGGNFIDSDLSTLATLIALTGTDVNGSSLDPLLRNSLLVDGYGLKYFPIMQPFSPAVDIGSNFPLTEFDQRRGYRIMRGDTNYHADAGAIEYSPFCVVNTIGTATNSTAVAGSLGWAIDGVNTAPDPPYSICFDLPGPNYNIDAVGTYSVIEECIIDGYTQPGSVVSGPQDIALSTPITPAVHAVGINGSNVVQGNGLVLADGDGHQIRGLSIFNFPGEGLTVTNALEDVFIEGNHIGVDTSGVSIGTGNEKGVVFKNQSNNNQLGDWYHHSRNVISNNDSSGVLIRGDSTHFNYIYNSLIGVDGYGLNARANNVGVRISDSASLNQIGDSLLFGNIISGNTGPGVMITDTTADINLVYGNFIGTDITGTVAIPNHKGVVIAARSNINQIGIGTGINRRRGNLISGNDSCGVEVAAWTNIIQSNYIGTDITGQFALPNGADGIYFYKPHGFDFIGGPNAGDGNVISGNGHHGINLFNTAISSIRGNIIGLSVDTTQIIPNHGDGIRLDSSCFWMGIGSDVSYEGFNVISGNDSAGIHISNTSGAHIITGNFIGTALLNNSFPNYGNGGDGILIDEISFFGSRIGDSLANGAQNYIAYNGGNGITILRDNGNRLYRNVTYENGGLGIDLGNDGVTGLDTLDPDIGANNLMNAPTVLQAIGCSNGVTVDGHLYSEPLKPFRIEFYATSILDPSGAGEGEYYIGFVIDSTDMNGFFAFNEFLSAPIPAGWFISATSTIETAASNSSEYSNGIQITAPTGAPVASNDTTVCIGSPPITLTSTAQNGGLIVWATDPFFTSITDTATFIQVSGNLGTQVYYTAELLGPCLTGYDSIIVTVIGFDDPSFEFNDFCEGAFNQPFNVANPGGSFTFETTPPDNAVIDPGSGSVSLATGGNNYLIQYATGGTCPDTAVVQVSVLENPQINTIIVTNEACLGDGTGSLDVAVTNGAPIYDFSLDGLNFQASNLFTGLTTGNYDVFVIDQNGCIDSSQASIGFDILNTLDAGQDVTVCPGTDVQLNAQGNGSFLWLGSLVSDSLVNNPVVAPNFTTTYYVLLSTLSGCVFVDSVTVNVLAPAACGEVINNAFSPDGDGVNDTWVLPVLFNHPENQVGIYNRWGDLLLSFDDYNNITTVWDGTNESGEALPSGTYYYIIKLFDDQNWLNGWVQIVR